MATNLQINYMVQHCEMAESTADTSALKSAIQEHF